MGIDSLFYMASHAEVQGFSVEDVARAQNVSESYLSKIFQQLVKAGLLRSQRGSKGGYSLGKPPAQITLRDIAVVFEGATPMYECNSMAKSCQLGPRCMILATFSEAERQMQEVLSKVSLQDVVNHSGRDATWIGTHNSQGQ